MCIWTNFPEISDKSVPVQHVIGDARAREGVRVYLIPLFTVGADWCFDTT